MPRKLTLLVLLLFPLASLAQYTNVTATVQDSGGNLYVNCKFSVNFVYPVGGTGIPVFSGTNTQFQTSYTGASCNAAAIFNIRLPANTSITPANSQWNFSVCDSTGVACFNALVTITGANQNISAALQAASVPIPTVNANATQIQSKAVDVPAAAGQQPTYNGSKFVQQLDRYMDVRTVCGLVGNGVTDDYAAMQACLVAYPGGRFYFPRTTTSGSNACDYYFTNTLFPYGSGGWLKGGGGKQNTTLGNWTHLCWAAGHPAIQFENSNAGGATNYNAQNWTIEDMTIQGSEPWTATDISTFVLPNTNHGVVCNGHALHLHNILITSFGGDGMHMDTAAASANCINWRFDNVTSRYNRGNGFYWSGKDSGQGSGRVLDAASNQLWGYYNNGGHVGNTFDSPMNEINHVDGTGGPGQTFWTNNGLTGGDFFTAPGGSASWSGLHFYMEGGDALSSLQTYDWLIQPTIVDGQYTGQPNIIDGTNTGGRITGKSLTLRNHFDSQYTLELSAGATANQSTFLQFDKFTGGSWIFGFDAGNFFKLLDTNSVQRLLAIDASQTSINSGGTSAVNVNSAANSGTGGMAWYSGGAGPALVGSMSNTGLLTANGGLKAGASGSTIADTRALVQSVQDCGTTAACGNNAVSTPRIVTGSVTLSLGTATITGISPAFTGTTTYRCVITDGTNPNGADIVKVSGSSFTVTGTGSDVLEYICIGN